MLPPKTPQSPDSTRRFGSIIIGAGYTGLAAARRMAELCPHEQILVIDATSIGEGSSGRNSGFMINLPHNTKMGGHTSAMDLALKQMRLYDAGLAWLDEIVKRHQIQCDWNHAGKFHAAAGEAGVRNLQSVLRQYRDWGIQYTEYDQSALQQKLGTPYYQYGFHTNNNVFVQPAALIRGLADSLPDNVMLAENEAVLKFEYGTPASVRTTRAAYTADRIIIANNSFAKSLGFLRSRLITIYTYAAMTPRLPDGELKKLGDSPEWGVIPANRLGTTVRRIHDGRLMVRSAYSYEKELSPDAVSRLLTDSYQRRYPNMRSHQFEYVWGGTTALTRNGATFFGKLRPGFYASLGCNGAGLLKGTIYGKLLSELAMEEASPLLDDALSMEGPSWLPPEPIRRIGVTSTIKYQAYLAGPER